MSGDLKGDDKIATIHDFLTNGGPVYALAALAIVVGLPVLLYRLPAIIKSVGECIQAHRKMTVKLEAERAKMVRAAESREIQPKKQGG